MFLGMVAHLGDCPNGMNGMLTVALERNLMARRRRFILPRNTELVCAQHFVRAIAEMREHSLENQKENAKKMFSKRIELSGGKKVFRSELTQ
jgi:hypothetical protein